MRVKIKGDRRLPPHGHSVKNGEVIDLPTPEAEAWIEKGWATDPEKKPPRTKAETKKSGIFGTGRGA